jgi:pyruvyl transferase EpsO
MDEVLQDLRRAEPLIPRGSRVLYLDVPNHFNVGDMLIFAGARAFLADCGANVIGYHSWGTFREAIIERLPEDVIVVLHGGGNFGDLYPTFQQFREEIVAALPRHRIVVFPQTFHFSSHDALRRSAAIFRSHRNVAILCRDHRTLDEAGQFCDETFLCPDMAHFLAPPLRAYPRRRSRDTLFFARRDIEGAEGRKEQGRSYFDWGDLFGPGLRALFQGLRLTQRVERKTRLPVGQIATNAFQDLVIDRAARYFVPFERVETDRMHAMLLALMLGQEVTAFDNSYGKLSAYADTWLGGIDRLTHRTRTG